MNQGKQAVDEAADRSVGDAQIDGQIVDPTAPEAEERTVEADAVNVIVEAREDLEENEENPLGNLQAPKLVGVCYGMQGNNLPSPAAVVQLYKANGIGLMRIYDPSAAALQALNGAGIGLILGVPNDALSSLASGAPAAATWVRDNVLPHHPAVPIRYIAVGNEVAGGQTASILPAMQNVSSALQAAGLQKDIKVSTAVAQSVLGVSFPPSAGAFSPPAAAYLNPIVRFLADHGAPLLANVYPYFAYAGAGGTIRLDYALFTAPGTVVTDGEHQYQNLFDAIVDALYAALERSGGGGVRIVVSESGWPSAGGFGASAGNARTYNQNLIDHVGNGTPRRPGGGGVEAYIFAMFNENKKPAGVEQNWGIFFPDGRHVYPINFH